MSIRNLATEWFEKASDPELKEQLFDLLRNGSDSALEDAFFQDLSFGTAGLRGIIGPGTNRMNIYTVGRATQGLADYILSTHEGQDVPSVAIARDSRNKGETFVKRAASILAANGIRAYIYPRIEPVPALSFAIRHLHCNAGICMTASHNPAPYNGYKAYGPDGCQISSDAAKAISAAINAINPFTQVKAMDFDQAEQEGLICWIADETLHSYLEAVLTYGLEDAQASNTDLSLVYTPLNGSGLECMEYILNAIGEKNVTVVESQKMPNGDFPTCPYPNPEERAALEEGIATSKQIGADLLLATDPDADRVGIAVKHNDDYSLLTGNEVGILLLDYICNMRKQQGSLPENAMAVSTIVSTAMIDAIGLDYGIEIKRTLTGFKYIGEIISNLEKNNEQGRFLLGFEESYGYLSGTHVRDKDAINASMLICQMARHYAAQGLNLVEALQNLYERYGYYANRTINIAFPGAEGAQQMKAIMEHLRNSAPNFGMDAEVAAFKDYKSGYNNLPPADVLEFEFEDSNKLIFRPSGTEPKIKVYLFAKGTSYTNAAELLDTLEASARMVIAQ